jgi:GT2 family glycosyltransferase
MRISAVIPTKNRAADLLKAVESILAQRRGLEELVVVDQSPGDESKERVLAAFDGVKRPALVYVHDTSVTGLVHAKRVGAHRACGDIVCFLEDDVILEPEYFQEIERGFAANAEMCGCSGVITNPPWTSTLYVTAHSLFFRGIFHDARVRLSAGALNGGTELIPCDVLSGGVSCWRREVLARVDFDIANGFFMFEDMEFSTRVVRTFGHRLYINPRARLTHVGSPVNRDRQGVRQRRKMIEAMTFYKKRREWAGARRGLVLGATWWLGEALLQAVRVRSLGPIRGYVGGLIDGLRKPLIEQSPDTP